MLADVTNRSRGPRGFQLCDGTARFLDAGASARLDLADHPLHGAWEAAGDVTIMPVADQAAEAEPAPHPPSRSQVYAGCADLPARGTLPRKGRRASADEGI